MTIQYKTKGVCSRQMNVKMENGVIQKVDILGGCAGNSQGVARLVEGMRAEDAIEKIAGIRCGNKATSCPDQLSKALPWRRRPNERGPDLPRRADRIQNDF